MAKLRFKALETVQNRTPLFFDRPTPKVSEYFGRLTFGVRQMKNALPSNVWERLSYAIEKGRRIDKETANAVAAAVKQWALANGASHYTHWFQPLTGTTAEKHDAFFDAHSGIEEFNGGALAQQEPDASSFPSGGMRSTFEARGYTAWDPSSPIFILEDTLCIPTVFISYTGEALDYKAPLLKSIQLIDKAATRVCRYFDRNTAHVHPQLGCEQEFFLIDKAFYDARPDLVMTGRTVFGHNPARGQQLDDHYFGSIPTRVLEFLKEFEYECLTLGIPVRTRHNEVAPSQFEVAPLYGEINVAADQNLLMMGVLRKVAEKHQFKVLFHEKPFANLNGSGKHNNWSLVTGSGINLFQPSSSARENLQFLVFLVNTIKAVHEHADLLRASIASAGNDLRLGGQEAPPPIISVFIGSQLSAVLDELEKNGNVQVKKGDNMYIKLGIDKIPEIILDNTDRNRTSPFAFTGSKFEFRAVGSEANISAPMTVLNIAVADQLKKFADQVDKIIGKEEDKRMAIIEVLREYIKVSKPIRFEGDGYSREWVAESAKRGLPNQATTPLALDAYLTKKSKLLYGRNRIHTEKELNARHGIMLQNYIKKIQIEARVMGYLALNHVIPTAVTYQNRLLQNAQAQQALKLDTTEVVDTIQEISNYINQVKEGVYEMIEERKRINQIADLREKAVAYCDGIKGKYFERIRYAVDKLELYVDDEDWPLPKYREMLFFR